MPDNEMKPCPLCRSEAKREGARVCCSKDKGGMFCLMSRTWFNIDEWNTRPIEEELKSVAGEMYDAMMLTCKNSCPYKPESCERCGWKTIFKKYKALQEKE